MNIKKAIKKVAPAEKIDRRKSIEQLEKDVWPNVDLGTGLIEKCHRYRKIPIQDLTVEQLRMLIGQEIGCPFLLPIAFDVLEKNILAEGDFYQGDLFCVVLKIKKGFWADHPFFQKKIKLIISQKLPEMESVDDDFVKNLLLTAVGKFEG